VSQPTSTCAAALARTLRDAGITRMFGLPGGEILEFIHAAKREGIEFLLTRHEAAAAFAADGPPRRSPPTSPAKSTAVPACACPRSVPVPST
jgi:acetolactate synthase-1/2/3 large subunit